MGLLRKAASVSTLGAVKFRTPRKRTARATEKSAREAKRIRKELARQHRA